jgi:hypothetical protein
VQDRVQSFHEAELRFSSTDRVVRAAEANEQLEALYVAREELAREAAGLLFARLQSVPGSREMGRLASRRIAALREIVNVTLAIARFDSDMPSPDRMSRILGLLVATIEEVCDSVLPSESARKFRAEWRARIEPFLAQFRGSAAQSLPSGTISET